MDTVPWILGIMNRPRLGMGVGQVRDIGLDQALAIVSPETECWTQDFCMINKDANNFDLIQISLSKSSISAKMVIAALEALWSVRSIMVVSLITEHLKLV
jgi:hypothetical protein